MPSAAARRMYEDQIPSFMSIINPETEGIDARDSEMVTMVDSKYMDVDQKCTPAAPKRAPPPPPQQAYFTQRQLHQHILQDSQIHRHNDSTSTQNSESADSSPTTTLTTDTSSISDPSPSSSPDSPVNLVPLNSFPATTFGGLPTNINNLSVGDSSNNTLSVPSTDGHLQRPMTSPSPRRRNMKGLSIQPPFGGNLSTATNTNNQVSEPASPCFIKPKIPAMKRKPSQLSLKTDSTGLNIRPTKLDVPASPGLPPILQRRSLKHSTSSPHMLSGMKSATFGPAGGMTLPKVLDRGTSGLSEVLRPNKPGSSCGGGYDTTILEEDSPIRTQVANRAAMDFEPFRDESEQNEDLKSPSYPNGPIAIYDNVYLYLEPTAEEASKFDTVINVAREVKNPFDAVAKGQCQESPDIVMSPVESPIPDTALTNDSFATAFEFPQGDRMVETPETPTTPKANPFQEPEYIHMPWDHNTDIGTDLMSLCETIDKRTKEGKKVLVHCQQGASRSASLIIAYGLYQNPGQSVNDAYYSAQSKSKWISPNMRLMYCLQDFQKDVGKRRTGPRSAAGPRTGRSPTKHRLTLSADAIDVKPKEPLTAPLPDDTNGKLGTASPTGEAGSCRPKSTPNLEGISPGPASAPLCFSWLDKEENRDAGARTYAGQHQLKPDPLPRGPSHPAPSSFFRAAHSPGLPVESTPSAPIASHGFNFGFGSIDSTLPNQSNQQTNMQSGREINVSPAMPEEDTLMSPRVETMAHNPLHDSFSELAGMKFVEQPPTPTGGLFSPRQTMFPRDPRNPFARPTQIADPRSPPTRGETPITRSIDDML